MRRNLAPEDLGDLLTQPKLAVLATRYASGEILLSPVWHEWSAGGFSIATGFDDVKIRQIQREPRISIVLAEDVPPYRGIEVRGVAEIVRPGNLDALRRIASRYLGASAGAAYIATYNAEDQVLIRLTPGTLRAWDFADEY